MSSLLIRSGLILTMNDRFDVVEGDVSIKDGRIAAIAPHIDEPHDRIVDARGGYVLPGLIQTHIHLCQTLFRGYADDLPLMDWLRRRVWPMEAARGDRAPRERDDGRPDDGDRARHRRGVRGGRAERTARDDRQVHDGFRR